MVMIKLTTDTSRRYLSPEIEVVMIETRSSFLVDSGGGVDGEGNAGWGEFGGED